MMLDKSEPEVVDNFMIFVLQAIIRRLKVIAEKHVQATEAIDQLKRELHELTRPETMKGE